jgi:hypothetical protein
MWTGRQTLASIEHAITRLHGEESQLDRALAATVGDIERLRMERVQSLHELARVKLKEMTDGRLVTNLDVGEQRAMQILQEYRLRVAAIVDQKQAIQKEVTAAETARHSAAATIEQLLQEADRVRAEAEARVQASQVWVDAKAARDKAGAIAIEAEKKAEASAAELGTKKKPYDADPLFAYLWQQRFGTAQYAGGYIVRIVDRMVAEFIDYNASRPNYATLIEIPLRLKEHASASRKVAEESQLVVAEVERRAMVEAGFDEREKRLTEARHKLAALDEMVENKRAVLRKLDEARAALLADKSAVPALLKTIADADAVDSLAVLYAEARRTPTDTDEAIVNRLEALDAKLLKAETEIADLRRQALDLSRRRTEMEDVRGKFRRTGYDHPQSTFGNDSDIGGVLKNVLEGVVRSGVLWDVLRQGHRSRSARTNTDFGSQSFPFPMPLPDGQTSEWSGGDWRNPSSRGGWLPGPAEPRRDDKDFTTGGSF